jgi:ABC-type glycerol-3-phosphate transport system substrate-binding protein
MIKRLLLVLALGAAFAACSPATSSTSPDVVTPTIEAPASMAPSIDVSPSP